MKVISNTYMFAFYVFVAFVAFTHTDSKQLEEDYTPLANNEIEELWIESNTEWGDISNPSY